MKIYLVRHGEAAAPHIDKERPLTTFGQEQVKELIKRLKVKNFHIDEIYHSGVLRAEQTASIIREELGQIQKISQVEDLLPSSNPLVWAEKLKQVQTNIMLVGHMPYMALLGEHLLGNKEMLSFSTASMLVFRYKDGEFHLEWNSQR